ncbi:MAG: hypothetical protein MUP49_02900, partial [Dehalococcoidia bacterium]|nr:hypothetical protein [Dehalococcoidia bacterium]
EATFSEDGNSFSNGTFEYWGFASGDINNLSGQLVQTEVWDVNINLNPIFGGTPRYPSPVNPRDLLPQFFNEENVPIAGTFGHGLGNDATLGGILPDMTQENWAPLGILILTETSSTESVLRETLYAKQGILDNGQVIGDMNGVFDFNNFDTVTITTGPWAGKGFSKGDCQATLEGVAYKGIWHGFLFFKPQERKIYLKGSTSGEISATVEGYLTESVPDSNVYNQYQATW